MSKGTAPTSFADILNSHTAPFAGEHLLRSDESTGFRITDDRGNEANSFTGRSRQKSKVERQSLRASWNYRELCRSLRTSYIGGLMEILDFDRMCSGTAASLCTRPRDMW
jgi:hypothetical protein